MGLGFLFHGTLAKGRGPLPDPLVTQGQDIGDTVKATSLVLFQRTLNDHLCLGSEQCLLGVISLAPNGFSPYEVGVVGLEEIRHFWWL